MILVEVETWHSGSVGTETAAGSENQNKGVGYGNSGARSLVLSHLEQRFCLISKLVQVWSDGEFWPW